MAHTLQEIAELAEFIAEDNTFRGTVSLDKIARKEDIAIHYGSFETYFTGMLQHDNGDFDIFLNLDKLKNKKYSRARFTLAHELGHYYIDDHRNLLKAGHSLSYDKDHTFFSNLEVEQQANHFATNLIMPKSRFMRDMRASNIGIKAVKTLADKYKTSFTATVIQYHNLLESPSFLIFWRPNRILKSKSLSSSFYSLIKRFSSNFLIDATLATEIFEGFDDLLNYTNTTSVNTSLAYLWAEISARSAMDMPVKIETMNLQTYGYVSLVFVNG